MAGKPGFDPQAAIAHVFRESTISYSERDAALYALGIGACSKDAVDEKELKYVYHQDGQQSIKVLPTFSTLFCSRAPSMIGEIPGFVFDKRLLLHGQQFIEIYKPLPSRSSIVSKRSVVGLHDKGKAAVIELEFQSFEKESRELLCMNRMSIYLRGSGGFSKSSQPYSYAKYPPNPALAYKIPDSKPFTVLEETTHPSQALLYRLLGDYNPLHSDPTFAQAAGFSRPILHGLCTLGFAVRAIIKSICHGDQDQVKNISGRFLLHVYPGETLIMEMWIEGLRVIYQVKVKERNKAVLSGIVTLNRLSSSL